jgi:hypothetical protein
MGISKYSPSKKKYFGTPPARSETGFGILSKFGLEQTFKIFKILQKHIPASGFRQGHSIRI